MNHGGKASCTLNGRVCRQSCNPSQQRSAFTIAIPCCVRRLGSNAHLDTKSAPVRAMILAAALAIALMAHCAGAANIAFCSVRSPLNPIPRSERIAAVHSLETFCADYFLALVAAV